MKNSSEIYAVTTSKYLLGVRSGLEQLYEREREREREWVSSIPKRGLLLTQLTRRQMLENLGQQLFFTKLKDTGLRS
jgi:hypothetical protein